MILTRRFWILLSAILCFFVLLAAFASNNYQATAASIQAQITPTGAVRSSSGPGMPAINPSLPTVDTIRFTDNDVRTYMQSHPFVGGHVISGATANINDIQFITSAQASVLMHGADTGLSNTAMVCYVRIDGPFIIDAPTAPGSKTIPPVDYGIEIFDAQTGNLLMWWIPTN